MGRGRGGDTCGADEPTPAGTTILDYVDVADLAAAHLLALDRLQNGQNGISRLQLNLGTGTGSSVREVVAAVEKATGRKVPVRETGRRAGDPPALVADARQAAEALGWKPQYSSIDTIVEHAARWHQRPNRPR